MEREITPQVAEIEARIAQRPSPRLINRLGTLYARYGLFDQAVEAFERALAGNEYGPALSNLGNISLLRNDYQTALSYFDESAQLQPDAPEPRIGLARTYFALAQYQSAREQYQIAQVLSPEMAESFSYIVNESAETGRASAAADSSLMIWEED